MQAKRAQVPSDLFEKLDRSGRGLIIRAELAQEQLDQYGSILDQIDRNHDGLITRAEFEQATAPPVLANPQTYAVLLLIAAFAGFCLLLDSLFDAERRELIWWGLGLWLVPTALAFPLVPQWYLSAEPYIIWVLLLCAVLLAIAFVAGATKPVEVATVEAPEKVYVVSDSGATSTVVREKGGATRRAGSTGLGRTRPSGATRRGSLAPGRVARRPPPTRPEPPERPPDGSTPGKKPPPTGSGPKKS